MRGDVGELIEKQGQLAERERRQHGQLLKTRDQLDPLAGELDSFVATPARIIAAVARAGRPADADPVTAPPQKQGIKLSPEEFLARFENVQAKRDGKL